MVYRDAIRLGSIEGRTKCKKDCGMGRKNKKFGKGNSIIPSASDHWGQLCRVPEDKEPKAGMWCEHAAHNRGRVHSNLCPSIRTNK